MTPFSECTLLKQGRLMSALPVKTHCLLFGDPEVPQPLPITLECCLPTPVVPRPPRACRGKVRQPPWSLSPAPHSPNWPSSRRHGLPRVHQVRCAETEQAQWWWRGSERQGRPAPQRGRRRGLGSFVPGAFCIGSHTVSSEKLIALCECLKNQ